MRKLQCPLQTGIYLYVLALGLFHLYTALFGTYEAYLQRTIHLTWVFPLAYLLYPVSSKAPK